LLCAMQGIDFRRPLRSSAAIERAHAALRAVVPMLGRDRVLSPDIAAAQELIAHGALDACVPEAYREPDSRTAHTEGRSS